LERIQDLIQGAKKGQKTIITIHVGGKSRRGKLSDEFNTLTANNSHCLIVLKDGDEDQFFSNIAKEKKIPIFTIDKILDTGNVLKTIFLK
jgi:hypothetical protein